MVEKHEKENDDSDRSEDESPEVDTPDDEPVDEETGATEEVEIDSEEPEERPTAEELSEPGDESAPSSTMEQFVDFDVWVATLEANFGPDFERVLEEKMGPDWNTNINDKMASGENFYHVVHDTKRDIEGGAEEVLDEEHLSFETLGADRDGAAAPGGAADRAVPGGATPSRWPIWTGWSLKPRTSLNWIPGPMITSMRRC